MSASDLLAEVVRATAGAADSTVLLDRVARVLAPRFGWVLADRLDEPDLVTRVAAHGPVGPLQLPAGASGPTARRSSAATVGLLPVLLATPQRMLVLGAETLADLAGSAEPHLAAQAASALALGAHELVLVGLVARDAVLGVLSIGSSTGLREGEVAVLADVALHVATCLDAVRLLAVQREIATAMQTSLLPPLPAVAGLRLAARYSPAARGLDVGGDWYDAFPTDGGLVVVVGDVRGHDLSAAARMADLRNLLRAHAVDRSEPPAALIGRTERTASRLGLDAAATLLVGRLVRDGAGWLLTWCSAGHLPPVLVQHGRARLLELEPDLLLGVQDDVQRADHVERLRSGDVLVVCTDGLVEQRDSRLDDRLEQLRALVEEHAGATPDALAEILLARLGAGSADDVALLVLQAQ